MRTLKEECSTCTTSAPWRSRASEEAPFVIGRFIQQYNSEWLLQRQGYMAEVRREYTLMAACFRLALVQKTGGYTGRGVL